MARQQKLARSSTVEHKPIGSGSSVFSEESMEQKGSLKAVPSKTHDESRWGKGLIWTSLMTVVLIYFRLNTGYLSAISTLPSSYFASFWRFFHLAFDDFFIAVWHSCPFYRIVKPDYHGHTSTHAAIRQMNSALVIRTVGTYKHLIPLRMSVFLYLLILSSNDYLFVLCEL